MATIDNIIEAIMKEKILTLEVDISIFIRYKHHYFVDGEILNAPDINGCAILTSKRKIKEKGNGIVEVTGRIVPERLTKDLIDAMRTLGPCDLEVFGSPIPPNLDSYWSSWAVADDKHFYDTQIHPVIVAQTASNNPRRILDVACADGNLLKALKCKYPKAELYGVELNRPNFLIAFYSCIGKIYNGDARNLDQLLPKGLKFDIITCSGFLSRGVIDVQDVGKVLNQIVNRLRRDGQLIITSYSAALVKARDLTARGLTISRTCFPENMLLRMPYTFYDARKAS